MKFLKLLKCTITCLALAKLAKNGPCTYTKLQTKQNSLHIHSIVQWHVEDLSSPLPTCGTSSLALYSPVLKSFRVKPFLLRLNRSAQHYCNLWFSNTIVPHWQMISLASLIYSSCSELGSDFWTHISIAFLLKWMSFRHEDVFINLNFSFSSPSVEVHYCVNPYLSKRRVIQVTLLKLGGSWF